MESKKRTTEVGLQPHKSTYRLIVDEQGPILVYGAPPLQLAFITGDSNGTPWEYESGRSFPTTEEPTALCRCGKSANKPYCDGTHKTHQWDATLTADNQPIDNNDRAEYLEGDRVTLQDNPDHCVFARFCDAKGRIWNLVKKENTDERVTTIIHEAMRCPNGRLKVFDTATGESLEEPLAQKLELIEDPMIHCSGPLWVKGGIPIDSSTGIHYQLRNRVALCRCGASNNKPFCDGSHASIKFRDNFLKPY